MTADVPRRLPRTQGQRVQNVSRTHAAQSLGGATAAARPVQNTTPTPTIYKPPTGGAVYDRFTVQEFTDDLASTAGKIATWEGDVFDSAGTSIGFNPAGDDGGIRLFAKGVYAATLTLNVRNISTVDPAVSVGASLEMWDRPDTESIATRLRGGDVSTHDTGTGTASSVFYSPGRGAANRGLEVYLHGLNIDDVTLGRVFVTLVVQRIS